MFRQKYLFLNVKKTMTMNKFLFLKKLFLLFLISLFSKSFAQIEYCSVEKFDFTINDSILKSWINPNKTGVIFFCPISKKNTIDVYNKKGLGQILSKNFKNANKLTYALAYFVSDDLNNSKNPIIYNRNSRDTFFIDKLECLIVNPDLKLLNRASDKLNNNFTSSEFLGIKNIFKIDIVEKGKCISNTADRLGFYSEYVSEVFAPKFSDEEKIKMLNDSLNNLIDEFYKNKIEQEKNYQVLLNEIQNLKNQINNSKINQDKKNQSSNKEVILKNN